MANKLIKNLRNALLGVGLLGSIIMLRLFVIEVYRIPSDSMNPTLISGDFVLVSKIAYGPRIINIRKLFFSKQAEFIWLKGLDKVERNDVLVFNYPQYEYLTDSVNFIYGIILIKRWCMLPGDTVRINRKKIGIITELNDSYSLFSYDSSFHWTPDNYGPLYVPRKGDIIKVTSQNLKIYKEIILYENQAVAVNNDSLFIGATYRKEYSFKLNYYFMLGDNFYQSRDSRYWGFLPETHIIGKATRILFSVDHNAKFLKKIRWNRILHKIESNTPEYSDS